MATAIGDLVVRLNAQSAPFERSMQKARGALGGLTAFMKSSVGQFAAFAAGAFGIKKAFDTLSFGVKLAADMEQAEVAFGVMLGSAKEAKSVLSDLTKFAEQTPFEFPELVDASKKLIAFGVGTEKLQGTLKNIGDIASGIGQPIGEIAELYGKARVQGRLFGEDINQLTGRGIPIIQELAKQFGVADSQVKKLVENGKVNFGHLEIAFSSLAGEGGKFGGMMERQSQTLTGLWSTFQDTFNGILRDVGATLIESFNFKQILENMIAFGETVKQNVEVLGLVFRNFGAIAEIAVIDLVQNALTLIPQMEEPLANVAAFFVGTWEGMRAFFGTWLESIKGGFMELKQFAIAIAQGIQAAWAALKAGEFRDIGSAFADAFINTLAQQQNVQAKNAFAEFGAAFADGQAKVLSNFTKAGGMSAALEARRNELLGGIAKTEFKRFEAMKPAAEESAKKTADALNEEVSGTKTKDSFAGAMERGSAEAWSTILAAWKGSQDKASKGEKEIVKKLDGVKLAIERMPTETVVEIS